MVFKSHPAFSSRCIARLSRSLFEVAKSISSFSHVSQRMFCHALGIQTKLNKHSCITLPSRNMRNDHAFPSSSTQLNSTQFHASLTRVEMCHCQQVDDKPDRYDRHPATSRPLFLYDSSYAAFF